MADPLTLIETAIPSLRRYARVMMRDASDADDLVQDCLERVVSHWHQRRGSDARAWMFAILHNLAVTRLRQARRRGVSVPLEDLIEGSLATPPGQEDALRRHQLLQALDSLPEDQRCVLVLISIEELSYAQAAEIIGVPVGTVMSRLARARERLWRLTEGEEERRPQLRRVK